MSIIADIQNSSLWQDVYSVSKSAELTNNVFFKPIDDIVVPFPIESQLTIVYADCNVAPPSWHSAGWLSRYVTTGVTVGGEYSTKLGFSKRCFLRRFLLIDWDTYSQVPRFVFKPHKWLPQIDFHIWQFTGTVSNTEEEKIDLARIDLLRLEATLKLVADRDIPTTYTVEID